MKQRNYSIDLLKFYLALLVAVHHTQYASTLPFIDGGFVVVMFFIISGYFLVRSSDSGRYRDPWRYTLGRVKRIWPYYVAAFVMNYVFMHRGDGLRPFVMEFFRSLPELFLLQNSGLFQGGINYPLWQLSTLVIASHIFFSMLQWNRQLTVNAICPVTVLLTYTYYLQVTEETAMAFVYVPMLRSAGALAMGIALHDPMTLVVKKLEGSSCRYLPAVVSGFSLFLILLLWTNRMTYALLIPFTGLLICMLYKKSIWARWFRHPVLGCLDKLSLGIYMNHALIVRILEENPAIVEAVPVLPQDITYLLIVILFTLVMMKAVDLLMALGGKCLGKEKMLCK